MDVSKDYFMLKIAQFEQAAVKFHEDSIANTGAAQGLKNILKELEEQGGSDVVDEKDTSIKEE